MFDARPLRRVTSAVAPAVLAAAFLVLAGWVVVTFNRLVRHRNLVREAWSGIDVQLKRRHDLVGNLVEAVTGHARFERGLLEEITRLRGEAEEDQPLKRLEGAENRLSGRVRTFLAVVEAYPDLRSSESFQSLQHQLIEIEEQLQMARRYYNGTVRDHNIRVESFPANAVARAFGFTSRDFFQVEAAVHRAAPRIELRVEGT